MAVIGEYRNEIGSAVIRDDCYRDKTREQIRQERDEIYRLCVRLYWGNCLSENSDFLP